MKTYSVGEMARRMGIPTSTLRYYDKEGLLPFVERTPGGIRVFGERDYEYLQLIECLKKTGMPLKEIREFVRMTVEGDGTIEARLALFRRRREAVERQIEELQNTLKIIDYKCWYYERAWSEGTTDALEQMPMDEIPEQYREAKKYLQGSADGSEPE